MALPENVLAAGGYLSPKEKLKNAATADPVSARSYRHAALGDRPVVRLCADNLAAGEDLTLDFLGFEAPQVVGPIALRLRQALGFPGWALVNDPKHARYALELVKGFKKAVRKSKAKPGHGYDEFVETSKQLGTSVAHFLPSFWEQVGREFIALDNTTYASRAFGKAREAEKVHALKVNEAARQDSFLEFALAGAVSIKALTEYSKELSSTHDAKSAWAFFRELCIRRVLGGMPPWPAMIKDMQGLITAAGLNLDQEVQSLLAEMIDSPAIGRSSMGFWESASKSISQLVKKNPHVAGALLNMLPKTSRWDDSELWSWLKYLKTWGILSNAWSDDVPKEAGPSHGAAAWFNKILLCASRPRQLLFDILAEMAPRLRRDNTPLDLYRKEQWGDEIEADVDLLDFALELGIPLVNPKPNTAVDLNAWANPVDADDGAVNRPRNPIHLVNDQRFSKLLRDAVQRSAGDSDFELAASGKTALQQARREWLAALVQELSSGGLPLLASRLESIDDKAKRPIFQEFPEQLQKLADSDILSTVVRTIQAGLIDEYGWPALEKVYEAMGGKKEKNLIFFGPFPYLGITNGLKVSVLKGDKVVHEAELKISKGSKIEHLLFIDGDLLVWVKDKNYRTTCFWNSDPQPADPEYQYFSDNLGGASVDQPNGGTFIGEKTIHRGDQNVSKVRAQYDIFCDGIHLWLKTGEWDRNLDDLVYSVHEVDPVTGKKGRKSLPSFLENFIEDGVNVDLNLSSLLPADFVGPKSPLGAKDGLIGFRVRKRTSEPPLFRIEGVDGRTLEMARVVEYAGLMNQPGTEQLLPLEMLSDRSPESGYKLWDPTGSYEVAGVGSDLSEYYQGQVTPLPFFYLHAFQIRDLSASKKLRSISRQDIETLLESESKDFEKLKSEASPTTKKGGKQQLSADVSTSYPTLDKSIRKLLGAKVHPALLTGLRGVLIHSGNSVRRFEKLVAQRTTGAEDSLPVVTQSGPEVAAIPYLKSLSYDFEQLPNLTFEGTIRNLCQYFDGAEDTVHVPTVWFELLKELTDNLPQSLYSSYVADPTDLKFVPFAEFWSQLPFQDLPGWFRRFDGETDDEEFLKAEYAAVTFPELETGDDDDDDDEDEDWHWALPVVGKKSRFLVIRQYGGFEVLEYSPDGNFESIPGLTEQEYTVRTSPPSVWPASAFRTFAQLASSNPVNIPPVETLQAVASAVQATPAEVALVWFGLPNFHTYSSNFMPPALRDGCKLKTKECSSARESLKAMSDSTRSALVQSVLRGDPAELWEKPPAKIAERLIAAWAGGKVERLPLAPEWVEKIADVIQYSVDKARFLEALNRPDGHPMFSDQGTWSFNLKNDNVSLECSDPKSGFNEDILEGTLDCTTLMAYGLPVGDPARSKIGPVLDAVRKALKNPGLLIAAGTMYEFDDKKLDAAKRLIESSVAKLKKQDQLLVADDGTTVVVYHDNEFHVALRTAKLVKDSQFERAANQLKAIFSKQSADDDDESDSNQIVDRLRLLWSPDVESLGKRVSDTPVPVGSYETNPILSVPELVQEVAAKFGISANAAAYYLQVLALPDPTDKNVQLWNGWTPAALKKIAAELLAQKLVLEATRSRAGRKVFLAGGWEDIKSPHLPLETWKMPLFQMTRDSYQRATPPLSRIIPLEPVHTLFEKAWKRIQDGDVPRYEAVKT